MNSDIIQMLGFRDCVDSDPHRGFNMPLLNE